MHFSDFLKLHAGYSISVILLMFSSPVGGDDDTRVAVVALPLIALAIWQSSTASNRSVPSAETTGTKVCKTGSEPVFPVSFSVCCSVFCSGAAGVRGVFVDPGAKNVSIETTIFPVPGSNSAMLRALPGRWRACGWAARVCSGVVV